MTEFAFDLNNIWFILLGVLLIGYAILDGFDLGVGALHLFAKTDEDRRIMINSIGPVWDGNEVWLITGGGAMFAAFPHVYATVFSGFYLAMMLLLVGLIFRAVSLEFRSKRPMKWWRDTWDIAFSVSSILIPLLMGVALGNIIIGIPVDQTKEYVGGFFNLLNPYALLFGITTVALFVMHGALYISMKTEGNLHEKTKIWARNSSIVFVILYIMTTISTLYIPHMIAPFKQTPILAIFILLSMLTIANISRTIRLSNYKDAFLSSSLSIAILMILVGIGLHPNLVISTLDPAFNLTIYNAASSQKTLGIMLTIALIGMPLVIVYFSVIYRVFRGKVKLDSTSY